MSNLLKNNAYHILGLDTSATQKDILKRSKDLVKLIQIDDIPQYDFDVDVFENFRTEDAVKEAVQKLTSPKKQIKEYFFWFNVADQIDEQAVGTIRMKQPKGAVTIWEHHTREDNSIKALFHKKNLAILYCLLSFKEYDFWYLKSSLDIWHELANSKKFWDAFSKVYKLNDELNTNQETIDDFQKNFISYVSDLYAELAEASNNNKFVAEFSKLFNMKGGKTSKDLLAPIFNEMTSAIEILESFNISEEVTLFQEKKKAYKFIDESGVFLKSKKIILKDNILIIQNCCNKLMELGLYDDSQARIIRDRAASVLKSISVDLNNSLNETSLALGLTKIADKISGTESLKNVIKKDLEQIEKNENYNKNKAIVDPIIEDYKKGNSERAIKTINEYIFNEGTEESFKKELRELKETIEGQIAKHGKPGSPSMGTLNSIGTKMYGDTLYFVFLFIPLIPISRWSCVDHGNGSYTFYGKLELTDTQKTWRAIGIIAAIGFIIWIFNS